MNSIIEVQSKSLQLRPLIPAQVFDLFFSLTTFYVRLGLNRVYGNKQNHIPDWYLDSKGNQDPSITQLIDLGKQLKIEVPKINDEIQTFEIWKGTFEQKLLNDITKFLDGSFERQIELHKRVLDFKELDNAPTDKSINYW